MKVSGFFKQKNGIWDLSNIFRFIDNLCNFNNDEFENNYNDIYCDELELKREDKDPCKVSFLDLPIEPHNIKFTTELFDKRNVFPFYINRMPYLDSNTPSEIHYAAIGSENLGIARTAAERINMVIRVNLLSIRMKNR